MPSPRLLMAGLALLSWAPVSLGCAPRAPAPAAPAAPAEAPAGSSLPAPARVAESPEFEPLLDAFAREHGGLQIPRVSLWPEPEAGSPWALLVAGGSEEAAVFEVSLEGGKLQSTRLAALPVAARAVAAVPSPLGLAVLLRSNAAFDQPAGLWGVQVVPVGGESAPFSIQQRLALGATRSEAELRSAIAALPAPGREADQAAFEASRHRQIQAAREAEGALEGALSAGGVALSRLWQGVLLEARGRLGRGEGPGAPAYRELLAAVRAVDEVACQSEGCPALLPDGSSKLVVFVREGGEARISALLTHSEKAAPPPPRAPSKVATNPDVEATRALLARLDIAGAKVVAEARLAGGGGTVGVFASESGGMRELRGVVQDGDATTLGSFAYTEGERPAEVRFADLDGDGRTDILLRFEESAGPPRRQYQYRVLLSPRGLGDEFERDVASDIALFDRSSIDEALRAAMALPQRGASRAEVCALLGKVTNRARRAEVMAPGARLIEFTEPHHILAHYTARSLIGMSAAQAERVAGLCESITCAPGRPACGYRDEISFHGVSLRFRDGRPLLFDVIVYTGS